MYQEILVILTIAIALFFVGRRLVRIFRPGQSPSCTMGCAGCGSSSTCTKPPREIRQ